MFIKKIIVFVIIGLSTVNIVLSQSYSSLKNRFIDAEYHFIYGEYIRAIPKYLYVYNADTTNTNVCYRLGVCYYNTIHEKKKAIPLFEKAVQNITKDKYRDGSYRETCAPIDAYKYLGLSYQYIYELDKAIDAYNNYKDLLEVDEIYGINTAGHLIETCENARKLIQFPVNVEEINLGEVINTVYSDYNPVMSEDGNTIIFTSKHLVKNVVIDDEKIFMSEKVDNKWTIPKNITRKLRTDGNCASVCLSYDGKELYLRCDDDGKKDIYVSDYENNRWNAIKKLNRNINYKNANETYAFLTKDKKTLYFSSNRKGGFGGYDIYKSEKNELKDWGEAVNLGPVINTEFDEQAPYLSSDGKTLYISSRGHFSIGGYDIFISRLLEDGEWSRPLNLGYPLNTTGDDIFFMPAGKGSEVCYSLLRDDGYGEKDLYKLKLSSKGVEPYIIIKGQLLTQDNKKLDDSFKITIIDTKSLDITETLYPDKKTGEFKVKVPLCDYKLICEGEGYTKRIENLNLPDIVTIKEFDFKIELIPEFVLSFEELLVYNKEVSKTFEASKIDEEVSIQYLCKEIVGAETVQTKKQLSIKDYLSGKDTIPYENIYLSYRYKIDDPDSEWIYEKMDIDDFFNYKRVKELEYEIAVEKGLIAEKEVTEDKTEPEDIVENVTDKTEIEKKQYFTIKNIYFDYDKSDLRRDALIEIEKLYKIMEVNPTMEIEVVGHTDARGSVEYNKELSKKRANAVINYLVKKSINIKRFISKGAGESRLVAINVSDDGAILDEGAQLNRRVEVKILKCKDTKIVVEDIYVPDHLKYRTYLTYSILIAGQQEKLADSYLARLRDNVDYQVDCYKTDKGYYYITGNFKPKIDAVKLLSKIEYLGFDDARIINNQEIDKIKQKTTDQQVLAKTENEPTKITREKTAADAVYFTIQLCSNLKKADPEYFVNLDNIVEYYWKNKYYVYLYGKYGNRGDAERELQKIKNTTVYKDAFIIPYDNYNIN